MVIENIMYFVLGLLVSGLLALILLPAVWRRAVRLTKKRIEAATPMTMAEFRADKDQLRAEFALSTRRLEQNVEALRRRLADQLRDVNRKKSELSGIKGERDNHLQIVRELEEREAEARRRILELEKEAADFTQKLRMRDRELTEKSSQLDAARESLRGAAGSTESDALRSERKRADFLDEQNRKLLDQLENTDRSLAEARAEAMNFRQQLAERADNASDKQVELTEAEARIADAETRVSDLLAQTSRIVDDGERQRDMLLAEKLSLEEEMELLRGKVASVEETVMADWDSDRIEQSHLRERLNDIASDVSKLVYALEGSGPVDEEESLASRMQKFVDAEEAAAPVLGPNARRGAQPEGQAVSDRLKLLREMQENN
jgi:chromosome segregation ATPase